MRELTAEGKSRFTWYQRSSDLADRDLTPSGFFELFFDDEVTQLIVVVACRRNDNSIVTAASPATGVKPFAKASR